tara:strand:+ start:656 stop:823 length:168 start_codon:yes stop_codon:yes gene_type:complete
MQNLQESGIASDLAKSVNSSQTLRATACNGGLILSQGYWIAQKQVNGELVGILTF